MAQLVLERIYTPEVQEVDSLDETARGAPQLAHPSRTPQPHTPAAHPSRTIDHALHLRRLISARCAYSCRVLRACAGEGGFGSTGVAESKTKAPDARAPLQVSN